MLVLLDERTWTSGSDTANFVDHIHSAMRVGVRICCVHEIPSVVGPRRHACDFALMFSDDWTPPHLTGGRANLYKEMDLSLKGEEWRQPGLVALAAELATAAREHRPIKLRVPVSYKPKTGANRWATDNASFAESGRLPIATSKRLASLRAESLRDEGHGRCSIDAAAMMMAPPPKPAPLPPGSDGTRPNGTPPNGTRPSGTRPSAKELDSVAPQPTPEASFTSNTKDQPLTDMISHRFRELFAPAVPSGDLDA